MKKLANVIKGHLSRETFEMINIISISKMEVEYCGTLSGFMHPDECMTEYQNQLMQAEVVKSYVNGGRRLDCFIQ